jgi:hypothetical protein
MSPLQEADCTPEGPQLAYAVEKLHVQIWPEI